MRALLSVLGSLAIVSISGIAAHAQLPQIPKHCSTPPAGKAGSPRKVFIENIQFDQTIHVPWSDVQRVIADTNQHPPSVDDAYWVDDFAEKLRELWQSKGYFKVLLDAQATAVGGDSSAGRFLVSAQLQEGEQYYWGGLQFSGGKAFSQEQLRTIFPFHEGDLFNAELVRAGLDGLRKLYTSRGYIGFTPEPEANADDESQRVSVVIRLDEQKQYYVRELDFAGLDASLESRIRALIEPGALFDPDTFLKFFADNKSAFPPGSKWEDLDVRIDHDAGLVDLLFDFRGCPVAELVPDIH